MTRHRVCFFSHSAKLEGADRSLLETAKLMGDRGFYVHVVLPSRGPLHEELRSADIPCTVWPYYWWLGKQGEGMLLRAAKYGAAAAWALGSIPLALRLRSHAFDVAYTNTLASPMGALVARQLGIPHIWHLREFVEEDHRMTFLFGKEPSLQLVSRTTELCIANSHAIASHFRPLVAPADVRTIYQAVELPYIPAPVPQKGRISAELRSLFLGRIQASKGVETAIQAVTMARARGIPVTLTLVGSGEAAYVDRLRREVGMAGLERAIRFRSFEKDPLPTIARHDVLLMCSTSEAFGRVTVEAMKCGTPVIGASSGGTTELIQEDRTGWLFSPGDAGDLARVLESAYEQRARLAEMGRAAQEWALLAFTAERYAERVSEAILDVISD